MANGLRTASGACMRTRRRAWTSTRCFLPVWVNGRCRAPWRNGWPRRFTGWGAVQCSSSARGLVVPGDCGGAGRRGRRAADVVQARTRTPGPRYLEPGSADTARRRRHGRHPTETNAVEPMDGCGPTATSGNAFASGSRSISCSSTRRPSATDVRRRCSTPILFFVLAPYHPG